MPWLQTTIARNCTLGHETSQQQLNSQLPFSRFDLALSTAGQKWPRSRTAIRLSISLEIRAECKVTSGSLALSLSHSGVRIPPSPPASHRINNLNRIAAAYLFSRLTRGHLPLKRTGERPPPQITVRKFDVFAVRKVASPPSCCSGIDSISSKIALCRRRKDFRWENRGRRVSEPPS